MRNRFVVFIFTLFFSVHAFAGGASGAALGTEIGAVLNYKAMSRGFAANDPRYAATLAAVGGAAESLGVAVVAAGTLPAWGTVLATAAVAGVVGYALQSLANYIFNKDGTVTVTGGGSGGTDPSKVFLMTKGGSYYSFGGVSGGSAADVANSIPMYKGWTIGFYRYSDSPAIVSTYSADDPNSKDGHCAPSLHCAFFSVVYNASGAPASCAAGMVYNGACVAASASSGGVKTTSPAATVLNALTDQQKATPLAPADVAAIADAAWKNAASQPGYAGLPYLNNDPVTAADVSAARASNPTMVPATVGDLGGTIPLTGAVTQPDGRPAVNPGTNPSSQPQINLGPDPVIGAPTLETAPTGAQILAPLLNLFPDLRSFVVPSHQAVCPNPSIVLWNTTLTLDSHCTLFETLRPTIYPVMAVVWILLAMLIFLAA